MRSVIACGQVLGPGLRVQSKRNQTCCPHKSDCAKAAGVGLPLDDKPFQTVLVHVACCNISKQAQIDLRKVCVAAA